MNIIQVSPEGEVNSNSFSCKEDLTAIINFNFIFVRFSNNSNR